MKQGGAKMTIIEEVFNKVPAWATFDHTVLIGYRGSDAHGTKLTTDENKFDDIDVFSIVIQPIEFYLGLHNNGKKRQHWDTSGDHLDILVYDFRKFMRLAAAGNPNTLAWLWNIPNHYLYNTIFGEILIDNRELFLSKEIFNRLHGYARAQMHRMTSFQKYEGYMGEKRKTLVDEHGYDIKNAAHVIRLLLMAKELGERETLYSLRPNNEAELIKDIKRGKFTIDVIQDMINQLIFETGEAERKSNLPETLDFDKISKMTHDIITAFNGY